MKGNRYKVLAGIAILAVGVIAVSVYRQPGTTEAPTGQAIMEPPEQASAGSSSLQDSTGPVEQPIASTDTPPEQVADEPEGRVLVDVSDAGVALEADEATLQQILDELVDKSLVEVVDQGPDNGLRSVSAMKGKSSFRVSGSIDDVLDAVMDQYGYSYVISRPPEAQSTVARLFLYGSTQVGGQMPGDTGSYDAYPSAGPGGHGGSADQYIEQAPVNISEVLRERALAPTANRSAPASSSAGSAGAYPNSGKATSAGGATSRSGNTAPITGSYQDEETQARLAELTRKASREVQALVESLKQAEQSLKSQQANQYGDTGQ